MKLLSKEEEQAHYNATIQGGLVGGISGLGLGVLGVLGASRRYPIVKHLTIPMKAFLITSGGTFAAIIQADRASRSFEVSRHPDEQYVDQAERQRRQIQAQRPLSERAKSWASENRYAAIGGSWILAMGVALGVVGRSPQSTTQKLVQARVYAQGLTVLVLLATAALEVGDRKQGEGWWETVKIVDPKDPDHKRVIEKKMYHEEYVGEDRWKDMVAAEERKMAERSGQSHKPEIRRGIKADSHHSKAKKATKDNRNHQPEVKKPAETHSENSS